MKAVYENGNIKPVDPLPAEWRNGQALQVEAVEEALGVDDEELEPIERDDADALMRAIGQHRSEQRELVRRELRGKDG